jgi:hypothetical protein
LNKNPYPWQQTGAANRLLRASAFRQRWPRELSLIAAHHPRRSYDYFSHQYQPNGLLPKDLKIFISKEHQNLIFCATSCGDDSDMLHSKGISFKPPHEEKEMQDLKDGYDWLKAESVMILPIMST